MRQINSIEKRVMEPPKGREANLIKEVTRERAIAPAQYTKRCVFI
jgi:hypothetical protein